LNTTERIIQQKIVAIVRLPDYDRAVDVARALVAGGVDVLEFTLTGRGAMEAVAATRRELGETALVGIGSVLLADQAVTAIDHGAQFIVTPALRHPVIAACVNRNVPIACGALTPTELLDAHEAGAELVKLFPARLGGPSYLKDVLAPLPFLKLVPTGGVGPENAQAYLGAGAAALGIGGNLIAADAVAAGDFARITATARECVAAVRG
jgi:2-dehydro-3-deoxyphosphogluconate aldolase / (4S)-4-hydroxy-2-oxoglutarate aldolase